MAADPWRPCPGTPISSWWTTSRITDCLRRVDFEMSQQVMGRCRRLFYHLPPRQEALAAGDHTGRNFELLVRPAGG